MKLKRPFRALTSTWRIFRLHWTVLVGALAIAALILVVNPRAVIEALATVDLRYVLLMIPCALLLYFVHSFSWWWELRYLHLSVSIREAVGIVMISQMFTFLPGGDLWRVPIVVSDLKAPKKTGVITGAVVFDDLLYFLTLTFFILFAIRTTPFLTTAFFPVLIAELLVFFILLRPSLYRLLVHNLLKFRLFHRFEPHLQLLAPTFQTLFTPSVLIPVVAIDILCSALATTLFYLGLAAVHAKVSWFIIAAIFSFSQVSTFLTVFPSALGIYEGVLTALAATIGITPALGAIAALLYRLFNDVFMALVGFIFSVRRDRKLNSVHLIYDSPSFEEPPESEPVSSL